ncbi:BRCT domain-containing protein [Neofusicoccum parvum]|uniref:BRCT domain-containing protein n=1 Tax=Neofusicoccum parvum TaxID=310453 RepID=A0ACB5RVT0_9PEZI|nr:BRCT domain-containing protein [Neofusicoccum parvum]
MASRRVPLANVPNATNSPYRPNAATATKRSRSHASEQRESAYNGQPPAKKQFFEENDTEARRQALLKKAGQTQSVQKKLDAARDVRPSQKPVERTQKSAQDNYDTIRQWQKHYRKVFPHVFQDAETRTRSSNNGDILIKAREMGMKIWALEKLERILNTMFNTETGEQPPAYNTRGSTAVNASKTRGADLSQLLKNEKVNGPADRDLAVSTKDMAHFRGYYVYIHCMNEKYRPVIMRDYPKTATKEDGKWPQFRLTAAGRCPFVEDPQHLRKLQFQDQQKTTQQRADRAASAAPRTRSASAALEAAKQRIAPKTEERRALTESKNTTRRTSATEESTDTILSKPLEPPKLIPAKRREPDGMPPLFGSAQASLRGIPRYAGGEPVASGVQPSNITSAIKSQMISSTAAAPGARAGTSKELHQLSRKVLEKNSAPNSTTSSYMTDIRAAINGDRAPPPRAAKRKAQETITGAQDNSEEAEKQSTRRVIIARSKKPIEKDPKPGYCENCREKFDDFDTHIIGRKHRKFATTPDNWKDLDSLLGELTRPLL